MNTYKLKPLFFALLLILFAGLGYSQNEKRSAIRENRDVAAFKIIKAKGALNVVLKSGDACKVVVEAPEGSLGKVTTKVKDMALTIKSSSVLFKGTVYVTMPLLEGLYTSGVVSVTGDSAVKGASFLLDAEGASNVKLSVEAEKITVELSGASKAELNGSTTTLIADISGASYLEAGGLIANTASINASGASRANISAKESVKSNLSGVSKLTFKEEPDSVEIIKAKNLESELEEVDFELNEIDHELKKVDKEIKEIDKDNGDTTILKIGKTKIIIIESAITTRELISSDDKKKKRKFNGHWSGIEIGYNGYLNANNNMELPAGYEFLELKDNRSIGVSINFIEENLSLKEPNIGLITGIGFTFNDYRFANNNTLLTIDSTGLSGFKDQSHNYQKSKLSVNYLTVPLIIEYQPGKQKDKFHIGAGIIGGIRLGSYTKMVYEEYGRTHRPKAQYDFYLNLFKCDATLRAGFGKINLFTNYSLISLFKKNKGPKLYPFMVGLSLTGW